MTLLTPFEPAPFETINASAAAPSHSSLICCDHASNRVPRSLNDLGLPQSTLQRHVALDIGAARLTRALAKRLDFCAVLATYSRLVVDLNRDPIDPDFIPAYSDGEIVPGNQQLSRGQIANRRETLFVTYQQEIARLLRRLDGGSYAPGKPTTPLICVHSFAPTLQAGSRAARPWDVGVLWNTDSRFADRLLNQLSRHENLCVGENQPYDGRVHHGCTSEIHAERNARPYIILEVRQDHIKNDRGVQWWADLLAEGIQESLDSYFVEL